MDNTHNCKTYIPTVMLLSCKSDQASRLHVLAVQQLMHVQIASCYIEPSHIQLRKKPGWHLLP